jgi:hypothetical protein
MTTTSHPVLLLLLSGLVSIACGSDGKDGAAGADGLGAEGPAGPAGPQGPEGQDGQRGPQGSPGELRVYGDGSAGTLTAEGYVVLSGAVEGGNLQFEDVVVAEGATLVVPSGIALRATGTIQIAGTIEVRKAAQPGSIEFTPTSDQWPRIRYPETGIAVGAPSTPVFVTGSPTAYEGGGGLGLGEDARFLLDPGRLGGGGGWFGQYGSGNLAAHGGGSLVMIAREAILLEGSIDAQGGGTQSGACPGCSGGGGGFVVLASRGAITTSPGALIDVRGGDGGDSDNQAAIGWSPAIAVGAGGGGGGCVHLIAPEITHEGAAIIDGGNGGLNYEVAAPALPNLRIGGAGGGASCGAGGNGARFNSNVHLAEPGDNGRYFRTDADPTALL